MNKTLYAVIHNHIYGTSFFLVRCAHYPTEEEVIKYCDIDFEPLKGESIDISDVDPKEPVEIPESA